MLQMFVRRVNGREKAHNIARAKDARSVVRVPLDSVHSESHDMVVFRKGKASTTPVAFFPQREGVRADLYFES